MTWLMVSCIRLYKSRDSAKKTVREMMMMMVLFQWTLSLVMGLVMRMTVNIILVLLLLIRKKFVL